MAFEYERRLWIAISLLPLALVFDILDGYVARLSPTRQSILGADLDSLAAVISCGLGPPCSVIPLCCAAAGTWCA
jgi:CDP-diacylglycerol--serine O-phosphatidyltransferase